MRLIFALLASGFLAIQACNQNKVPSDFEVTPTGYPFKFHVNAEGEAPKPGEYVYFQLHIRNDDSTVYSTRKLNQQPKVPFPDYSLSSERPAPQMDALRVMSPGDSVTIYYRIDTLNKKPRGFENSDMVYYDIVLEDIKSVQEFQQDMRQAGGTQAQQEQLMRAKEPEVQEYMADIANRYRTGELDGQLQQTETGLKYFVLEQGTGEQAQTGSMVQAHYYGVLPDGRMFDNSYRTGRPYRFIIGEGQVIPGWEEGFSLLKEGATAIFFVPPLLAYGEKGSPPVIPANTELLFYVELENVQ